MTADASATVPAAWYYASGPDRQGPVSRDEIATLAAAGVVHLQTLVWRDGMTGWLPITQTELGDIAGLVPPPRAYVEGRRVDNGARDRWLRAAPGYRAGSFGWLYGGWIAAFAVAFLAWAVPFAGFLIAAIRGGMNASVAVQDPLDGVGAVVGIVIAMVLSVVALLICFVLWFLFFVRCWEQVDDGSSPQSPALAVGLHCIPCFTLYWAFVSIRGLAVQMNRVMHEHGIPGPRPSVEFAVAYCIVNCMTLVPYVGSIAYAVLLVMGFFLYFQFKRSAQLILAWRIEHAAQSQIPAAPVV